MINKILFLISINEKMKVLLIILGLFIISLLEMISIGSIPAFVYFFLDTSKFINFLKNYNLDFSFINDQTTNELLILSSIILISIFILKNIFIIYFNYFHYKFTYQIKSKLCLKIFSKYINEDYETIKLKSNSEITRDVLIETSQFVDIIDNCIVFIREILLLIGIVIILALTDPIITMIIGGVLSLVLILFYFFFRKKINKKGLIVQFERERLFSWINQTFGSIIDIKVFNNHNFFYKLFSESVHKYEKQNLSMNFISSIPRTFLEVLSVSIILFLILIHVYMNELLITFLPLLSLLVVALVKMIPSFNNLMISINTLKYRKPSLNLIYRHLENFNDKLDYKPKLSKRLKIEECIKLNNLSYRYPDGEKYVLKNINIRIKINEFTVILGKSGSGKSTLMLILLGLIEPTSGDILLDEIILNDKNKRDWQNNISYVSQNPYLLNESLKSNIIFGQFKDQVDEDFLNLICKVSKVDEFACKLEKGLDTVIKDNGSNLSGGQKQRISIARALYKNPKLIFFDEATNALDENLEKEIFKSITHHFPKLTKIVITHRINSAINADKIIYFENEKILEYKSIESIKDKYLDKINL